MVTEASVEARNNYRAGYKIQSAGRTGREQWTRCDVGGSQMHRQPAV